MARHERITQIEENVITVNFCPVYTLQEAETYLAEDFQAALHEWPVEKLKEEADKAAPFILSDHYDAYMAIYNFRTRGETPAPDNVVPFPTPRREAA
jgi:hypothetical protein